MVTILSIKSWEANEPQRVASSHNFSFRCRVEVLTHPCRLDKPRMGQQELGPLMHKNTPVVDLCVNTHPAKSASAYNTGISMSKGSASQPTCAASSVVGIAYKATKPFVTLRRPTSVAACQRPNDTQQVHTDKACLIQYFHNDARCDRCQ